MVAYAFYRSDEKGKNHFIGILPERRKNPERITQTSISNLGRSILGNNADVYDISFVLVTIDESTGEVSWPA
jgi:hypothetical protein